MSSTLTAGLSRSRGVSSVSPLHEDLVEPVRQVQGPASALPKLLKVRRHVWMELLSPVGECGTNMDALLSAPGKQHIRNVVRNLLCAVQPGDLNLWLCGLSGSSAGQADVRYAG